MKKYKNLILVTMISGILGVFMGLFSEELSEINFTFTGNINDYLFKIFLVISCIITIYLFITLIYIRTNYKKINLDEIPKSIERTITKAINYSTVQLVLGLTWYAIVINKNFDGKLAYFALSPAMSIFIAILLQSITIKYYNYLYPNRKLNIFENKAEEKFFQRLDEGQKWVTFNCSYATFTKMQFVYCAIIIICIVLSMLVNVPMILPIVVGILWIIQISIYMLEEKKYEE